METNKLNKLTVILLTVFIAQTGFSCSNIFIRSIAPGHAATVGRSLDFASSPGYIFAKATQGVKNVSNVNVPYKKGGKGIPDSKVVKWTNKYGFIGMTFQGQMMIEGVNTEGLYVGNFYFPGVAQYQQPIAGKASPILSYGDLIPYLLGISANVEEAVDNIKKVQVILTGSPCNPPIDGKYNWTAHPFHWALRDKDGRSAVIEYVKGKLKVYTDTTEPRAGQVLTNSPAFPVQRKYYTELNNKFHWQIANTKQKWNGLLMNGSGLFGVPGDWTSPSRFVRGSALIKVMPKPKNHNDANYLAYSAINSLVLPPGADSGPTLWTSISDLVNGTYRIKILSNIISSNNGQTVVVQPETPFSAGWHFYNVIEVVNSSTLPVFEDENKEYRWEDFKTERGELIPNDQLDGIFDTKINSWNTALGAPKVIVKYPMGIK